MNHRVDLGLRPRALDERLGEVLERRRCESMLRVRRVVEPLEGMLVRVGGRTLVNFSGNDYLGLGRHRRVIEALGSAHAAGSGASALVSGYGEAHRQAEAAIAEWKSAAGAVLLGSGYQANLAAVQTLAASGSVRFLVDKLAHASLIDAVRQSGAPLRIYPHNNLAKLRRLLASREDDATDVVVTESIFSMDGDAADLAGLAQLKREFGFWLLLDEAHGSGVFGRGGTGYAEELGLGDLAEVTVVTLSKAIGVGGGAVVGSAALCEAIVNFGRAYIYSTAISPAIATAISAAIGVMREEPQRQARVRATARRFRGLLAEAGWPVGAGDCPIVPVVLGDAGAAVAAATALEEAGFLCAAVRPPTVPRGSSRLRITLSAQHSDDQIDRLVGVIARLRAGGA